MHLVKEVSKKLLKLPPLREQALNELWGRGLRGRALLQEYSLQFDSYLSESFNKNVIKNENLALIALGGYGRCDLHPYADIDLLILYDSSIKKERIEEIVSNILYPLWDASLDVGHSVRKIDECIKDAEEDFFLQVALLDARLIEGNSRLFKELISKFNEHFIQGRRKEFVEQMLDHIQARISRFGKHSYLLEPNIKESRGGLRDLHNVLWTAKAIFGLNTLKELESAGLLTLDERKNIEIAWDELIEIRNQLHLLSNRKNDRLYFEYQLELAKIFGHKDKDGMLAVEHFMSKLYSNMRVLSITHQLFFEHVLETIHPPLESNSKELELGIEVVNNRIYLSDRSLPTRRPYIFMRLFYHSAKHFIPVHHSTRRFIRANLRLIDDKMRSSKRMRNAFLSILSSENPLFALEPMLEIGLLSAYIPEFAHIESLAQHDVYHTYTVDRHCLETVSQLAKLRYAESAIFNRLKHPHILLLAGLLHDIGKGFGHGHAQRGARMAAQIGSRMGLSDEEIELLVFLIENHLFLMDTALRRDLDDENFILRCARHIGDSERLNSLYLLSIADAKATGPNVWGEWKAALLLELYLKIAHLLERKDLIDPDRIQNVEWMRQQIRKLIGTNEDIDKLPEEYLLSFTPEDICSHLNIASKLKDRCCFIFPKDKGNCWQLLIIARDCTGLLARICGVLALHNLGVLGAQIFTWKDGTAVDLLELKSFLSISYEEQDWDALEKDLIKAIEGRMGIARRLEHKGFPVGVCKVPKGSGNNVEVLIDNKSSDFYTIIEVYANERPGLLYDVTRTLSEFDINIYRAKIGPRVDQVVDVFYVLDKWGQKVEDPELQEEIKLSLLYVLRGR